MIADSGERQKTNVSAIYFCAAFVVIVFGFVGFCFVNGSIFRLTRGVDDCGYICGRNNKENGLPECKSPDKTALPLTKVDIMKDPRNSNLTITHSVCVKSCKEYKDYEEIANRCWKVDKNSTNDDPGKEVDSFLTNVAEDFATTWPAILITCVVALVFSYVLLMLFRYAIKYVIWVIYIGIVVLFVILAIVMVVFYIGAKNSSDPETKEGAFVFLIIAGVLGLFALILGAILYFFRKRIRLVVQLFKEASRVLIDVPLIIFEPLLTFISLALACVAFLYFALVIQSSGDLTVYKDYNGKFDRAVYEPSLLASIAHLVNLIAFMWFQSFVMGCQHFVIASTVCQWFFTRTKDKLDSPIQRAFSHLINFHLGSICLGSILITILKIIRMIIDGLKRKAQESQNPAAICIICCIDCIYTMIEELLKYLVRNAYIIVALNGTALIESGKKAFGLLSKNLIDVIALNQFGDFVLVVGRLFVTAISGFVCYELVSKYEHVNYPFIPIVLSIIFAFMIVNCFVTVFEMTVDTIFICFCEDCEINDGYNQPFFMSRGLMEAMYELKGAAGGEFTFGSPNPGGEAGQPPAVPIGWKFGNDQH